jgi:hypothetical protein
LTAKLFERRFDGAALTHAIGGGRGQQRRRLLMSGG